MDIQKDLIEKILKDDLNGVKDILITHKLNPDICDEHGMTPLEHAAYKGNKDMVQLLLDQGAVVNSNKHVYDYTALHFAALSGSTDVCRLLLEHGAKMHATNSVGRTPSQMATFVGNHACVTTINNFVPKSDIDYYTVPSGFEVEPKLPVLVSAPLHKFVMEINLNPVKIAINLLKSPLLLDNIEKVKNVLELMSEREMKRGIETNEIMSFKFHYFQMILDEISKLMLKAKKAEEQDNENNGKKPKGAVEVFIKKMLHSSNGVVQEYQDAFLRDIVKKFHYKECATFMQLFKSLVREDSPDSLSVITSIVNGQRGFIDSDIPVCATCGEEKVSKKCSQCKSVQYCDRDCQKYHWFVHKKYCKKVTTSESHTTEKEKSKEDGSKEITAALKSEMANLKVS